MASTTTTTTTIKNEIQDGIRRTNFVNIATKFKNYVHYVLLTII